MVADRISSIIIKLHHTTMLSDYHISSFFYLIVTMETNPLTAHQERIESFVVLFRKLGVYRQCLLIIDFQTNHQLFYLGLKVIPSCQQLFRQLYELIASSDLHSCSSMWNLTAPIFKIFVEFGDQELLRILIDNLTHTPVSEGIDYSNNLLDSILLSHNILDLAISSELGKNAIFRLVDFRIKQLVDVGFLPETDSSTEVKMEPLVDDSIIRHNSALQASLASYIYLVLQMETVHDLADPHRVLSIGWMVFNLTFERLCDLILDIHKFVGLEFHLHPRANELFVELCRMLIEFDRDCSAKVCSKKIIQIMKCFVWLEDRDLVQSLIYHTCLGESYDLSNCERKNIFIEIILFAPDVIGRLIPEFFSFTSITLDALFEAWVKDICDSLDSAPDSSQEKNYANFSKCVELYIRNEKQFPQSSQRNLDLFSSLLAKLPDVKCVSLSLILARLLVKIHQADAYGEPFLKETATCLDLFRKIALQFVNRDLTGLLKSVRREEILNCLVDVTISLLWLGDQDCLVPFVQRVCSAFQKWQENPLVSKIVTSTRAREMAKTCRYSRESFCLLLQQRINRLKMIKAKESTVSSSSYSPSSDQESNVSLSSSQIQRNELKSLYRSFTEQ